MKHLWIAAVAVVLLPTLAMAGHRDRGHSDRRSGLDVSISFGYSNYRSYHNDNYVRYSRNYAGPVYREPRVYYREPVYCPPPVVYYAPPPRYCPPAVVYSAPRQHYYNEPARHYPSGGYYYNDTRFYYRR